jgi:multidrug efflux pump
VVPGAQEDRRHPGSLPQGVVGPFFNDEYGDTYALIWAFEADGFSDAEVKAMVKEARLRLLRVPEVTKADLFGVQDEKIYIEFSHARLAMLGVPVDQILDVVRKQNAIAASGTIETRGERMAIRVDGAPTSAEQLMALPFSAAGRTSPWATWPRSSAATPTRARSRCASTASRCSAGRGHAGRRQRAGARQGAGSGDGRDRETTCRSASPCHRVANQPEVVQESVHEFSKSLAEALASCWSSRSSAWASAPASSCALSVPLVLAITFVGMMLLGIDFQRISLGALIIALGLLWTTPSSPSR